MRIWTVSSNTISRLAYDANNRLYVEFTHTRKTYRFDGVQWPTVNDFIHARSKGAFFNARIRNGFPQTQCAAFPDADPQRPFTSQVDWSRCGPKLIVGPASVSR
jgi:hypothetical protein